MGLPTTVAIDAWADTGARCAIEVMLGDGYQVLRMRLVEGEGLEEQKLVSVDVFQPSLSATHEALAALRTQIDEVMATIEGAIAAQETPPPPADADPIADQRIDAADVETVL
jgi:hypothetical protein